MRIPDVLGRQGTPLARPASLRSTKLPLQQFSKSVETIKRAKSIILTVWLVEQDVLRTSKRIYTRDSRQVYRPEMNNSNETDTAGNNSDKR